MMEEEDDSPESVPHTDAEEYKVDRHSGGSVPSESLDLLSLEAHPWMVWTCLGWRAI